MWAFLHVLIYYLCILWVEFSLHNFCSFFKEIFLGSCFWVFRSFISFKYQNNFGRFCCCFETRCCFIVQSGLELIVTQTSLLLVSNLLPQPPKWWGTRVHRHAQHFGYSVVCVFIRFIMSSWSRRCKFLSIFISWIIAFRNAFFCFKKSSPNSWLSGFFCNYFP